MSRRPMVRAIVRFALDGARPRARVSVAAAALCAGLLVASGVDADPTDVATEADFPEVHASAGCDSAAGREADVAELIADMPVDRTLETPRPTEWRTARGRSCRRHQRRMVCDGPLRVPAPFGPEASFAATLGLDDETRVGRVALNAPPDPAWLEAVRGEPGAGLLWPVPDGRMWRGFGRHRVIVRGRNGRLARGRRHRQHRGVDIGAPAGSAIRAVNDGLVLYSFNGMRGYGNSVVLLHADGSVSLYAHCQATLVFAGQRVRRGQVIAEVGHTGLAHGDHLHFEWRHAGRARNPAPHFVGVPDRDDDPVDAPPPDVADADPRPTDAAPPNVAPADEPAEDRSLAAALP